MFGVYDPARDAFIVRSVPMTVAAWLVRQNPGTKLVPLGPLPVRSDPSRCRQPSLRRPTFEQRH
jgi:hypothetical protein